VFLLAHQNLVQREQILRLILKHEDVAEDVDIGAMSDLTEGMSGSDLNELCRTAAVYRLRNLSSFK